MTRHTFTLASILLLQAAGPRLAGAGQVSFGFNGPEIFPIDQDIAHLRSVDLDGDGLTDLVIANNARSKITLLYNQTGKTNTAEPDASVKRELNELPAGSRFKIDSVASEKRIHALSVADLNQDGKPDLAYYGEPNELVVQYNEGDKAWSPPKRWPIQDVLLTPNAMATGDLTGDGLNDLILLGENQLHLLTQSPDHTLAEPVRIPYSGALKSVQILDIDGNGDKDLLLVNWDSPDPFRFRLQGAKGQLGPETYFSMLPIRSYWADDLDGDGKTEVIVIAQNSGRAQISNFARHPSPALSGELLQGQFQVLPLNKTSKAKRAVTWADLNGDQLDDLVVSEPDGGQISVHLQLPDGSLPLAKTFPALAGVSEIAVTRKSSKAPPSLYLLSQEERQIGVTQYDHEGRVAFPTALPIPGKPLALAAGSLAPGEPPAVAVLTDQADQRNLWIQHADGTTATQPLAKEFRSTPSSMTLHDIDQDGLQDLIILIPYEKIKLLLQRKKDGFEELDVDPPGGNMEQPWVSTADVDGDGKPELLMAQKNFVRAVVLQGAKAGDKETARAQWTLVVKDQINGATSTSKITGAAALPRPKQTVPSLFLLDAERKMLSLCERDKEGVWQILRNLPLPFSDFYGLQSASLGSQKPNAIAFSGLHAAGWMRFEGDTWELAHLDGYETPVKNGRLMDVVSGDLNQDGRKDLVFLETAKNHLDLVIFEPDGKLTPANRWQVFQERTFRSRRGTDQGEPREALIIDLTGDGRNDLALVVHDRILVYLQE